MKRQKPYFFFSRHHRTCGLILVLILAPPAEADSGWLVLFQMKPRLDMGTRFRVYVRTMCTSKSPLARAIYFFLLLALFAYRIKVFR